MTVVTVVRKIMQPLHKNQATSFFFYFVSNFGKSNLTHLTTHVMFLGQRFAILAMLFREVAQFYHSLIRVPDFFCEKVA